MFDGSSQKTFVTKRVVVLDFSQKQLRANRVAVAYVSRLIPMPAPFCQQKCVAPLFVSLFVLA